MARRAGFRAPATVPLTDLKPETPLKPSIYPNRNVEIELHGSYELTRILFLRYLAFIYAVAFAVALNENEGLIGDNGLTPAAPYLGKATFLYC